MKKVIVLCSALVLGLCSESSAYLVDIDGESTPLKDEEFTPQLSLVAVQERMNKLNEASSEEGQKMFRRLYSEWFSNSSRWTGQGRSSTISNIQGYCAKSEINNFKGVLKYIEDRIETIAKENAAEDEDEEGEGGGTHTQSVEDTLRDLFKTDKDKEIKVSVDEYGNIKIDGQYPQYNEFSTTRINQGVERETGKIEAQNTLQIENQRAEAENKVRWANTFDVDRDGYIKSDKEGDPVLNNDAKKRLESEQLSQKHTNELAVENELQSQITALETTKQTNEAQLRALRFYDANGNIKVNEKGKAYINESAVEWIEKKVKEATHEIAVDTEEQTARHALELSKAQVLTNLTTAIGEMEGALNEEKLELTQFDLELLSKIMREVGVDVDENFIVGMKRVWGLTPLNMSITELQERIGTSNVDPDKWGNPMVAYNYTKVDPSALTNADVALLLLDHFSDTDTERADPIGDCWDLRDLNTMRDLLSKGRELIRKADPSESAKFILNSLYGIENEGDDYRNAIGNLSYLLKKYGLEVNIDENGIKQNIKSQYIGEGLEYPYEEVAEFILKSYGIKKQWKDDIAQKIIEKYVELEYSEYLKTTVINLLNWTSIEKTLPGVPADEIKINDNEEQLSAAILRVFGKEEDREEAVENILSNSQKFDGAFGDVFNWRRTDGHTLESDIVEAYCDIHKDSEQMIQIAEDIMSQATDKEVRRTENQTLEEALDFLKTSTPASDPSDPPIKESTEEMLIRVLGAFSQGSGESLESAIIRSYSKNNHAAETAEIIIKKLDPEFTKGTEETFESAIISLYGTDKLLKNIAWNIAKAMLEFTGPDHLEENKDLSFEIVDKYRSVLDNERKTAEAILSSIPIPVRDGTSYRKVLIPIERESSKADELHAMSLEYEIINTYGDPYVSGENLKTILETNFDVIIEEDELSDAILRKKQNTTEDEYEVLRRITGKNGIANTGNLANDIVTAFTEKAVGYVIKDKTGIEVDDQVADFDEGIKNAFVNKALMERYGIAEDSDLCRSYNKMKFHVNLVARILQQISNERDVTKFTPTGIKTRAIWFTSFRQYMLQSFRDALPLVRLAYKVNHDKWLSSLQP